MSSLGVDENIVRRVDFSYVGIGMVLKEVRNEITPY